MKELAAGSILSLIVIILVIMPAQAVEADQEVYIRSDGSIDPSTAPVQRIGDIYFLTGNISGSITIERDNMILDGKGFTLHGANAKILYNGMVPINITIRNFHITGSSYSGISLAGAHRCLFANNTITNSSCGIELVPCPGGPFPPIGAWENMLVGNTLVNNGVGIFMMIADTCVVVDNDLVNNTVGIELEYASASVRHNNFMGNINQTAVYLPFLGSVNYWDRGYPAAGNFWSNYNGTDLLSGPSQNVTGEDGIGDTPYVIDSDNVDHYPLVNPWPTWSRSLGDVNGDRMVNILDIGLMANAFNSRIDVGLIAPISGAWELRYNPEYDVNNDGLINIIDITIAARNFGNAY